MHALYINPLTPSITITLLEDGEVRQSYTLPSGSDFEVFPDMIMQVIDENTPDEVWTIIGPGAFTRMRIITLTLSTLALSRGMVIKGCHFFDLIDNEHIPLLRANDAEYLIRESDGSDRLKTEDQLIDGKYMGYDAKNHFTESKVFIEYRESWGKIWKIFSEQESSQVLSPVYIKTPHITWSKKNT